METRRKVGRPISFDRADALERAMVLFWRYGYEATSVSDLTTAMGISPPSLYAAFGDKKRLFLEAVALYMARGPVTLEAGLRASATAREAVANLLRAAAEAFTGPDTPAGCMLVSAATNCTAAAADIQAALGEIRLGNERLLRDRIKLDVDEGRLPAGTDAGALASLYMAVIQGMSTQARDGAGRPKLLAIADAAMQAWPAERPPARD